MRKNYLDNIRWATVVLVVVYHVFYLFNACGVLGNVGSFSEVQYQDALLPFVYPWFMVLLFAAAGMSSRYDLEKKSGKEFIKARTLKLLVPSTLGLLVYQWLVGFFNVYISGALEYFPESFLIRYPIFALSGTGPLWFAQTLWLYSLLLPLLRKIDKNDKLYALCDKFPPILLPLLFLPLWGSAQIGNMPVIVVYRLGIYLAAYLMGYFFLSQERSQDFLGRYPLPLAGAALILGISYVVRYFDADYTTDACLRNLHTNLYAWIAVLAVLGCGKAYFDKSTPFTARMSSSSFGIYVLHYGFVAVPCYLCITCTSLPAVVCYPLCILAGLAGSYGCYELFRRIPFVRYTVLGIRGKK